MYKSAAAVSTVRIPRAFLEARGIECPALDVPQGKLARRWVGCDAAPGPRDGVDVIKHQGGPLVESVATN